MGQGESNQAVGLASGGGVSGGGGGAEISQQPPGLAELNGNMSGHVSGHIPGNMLDRAIASVFPVWGAKRLAARCAVEFALGAYAAADKDRTTADWDTDNYSANSANFEAMADVTARARLCMRNDWLGPSIRSAKRRNVVGAGITPRANARDQDGKPLTKFNEQMDILFRRWSRDPKAVDVEGRKSLHAMMRLMIDERTTVGSGFLVMGYEKRRSSVGLTFQMFEVAQLSTEKDTVGSFERPKNGNIIRRGIELDGLGRPVAYWVYLQGHPLDSYTAYRKAARIEADRVLHFSSQGRPGETLAISPLAPVLSQMFNRQGYDQNEMLAKKIESFLGFVITRKTNSDSGPIGFGNDSSLTPGPGGKDSLDANKTRQLTFEKGMVPVLNDNEEIDPLKFDRPGANYDKYMDRQVGMIAAGSELSGSVVKRQVNGSYAGARQEMLEDWKGYDIDQQDLIDQVLRVIWERFVFLAILEGRVSVDGFFTDPDIAVRYLEADWQPPARPWVDPAKEMAAIKIAIDYGLANHADVLNRLGVDWRENLRTIAEVSAMFKDLKIPMPWLEPKASPSEPKVHGTGDDAGKDKDDDELGVSRSSTDVLSDRIIEWSSTGEG